MSFGGTVTFGSSAAAAPHNPNKDAELVNPPNGPVDGISSLSWSPLANYLIVTSWDNHVRCYNVQPGATTTQPGAMTTLAQSSYMAGVTHQQPVLCSAWLPDGQKVVSAGGLKLMNTPGNADLIAIILGCAASGSLIAEMAAPAGCNNEVKLWDLGSNQQSTVGRHDGPVRHCAVVHINQQPILCTASWDKTLRYWDMRQPQPMHQQAMQERVFAMDVKNNLLVAGLANRHIQVFNMQAPQQVFKEIESPLKYQTRCITCFPDSTGYMVGSIEGRVAVQHVDDAQQSKNFTFKCHRDGADVYSVNHIDFHPQFGTFVTAGSDGSYNFWDKDSKQRLKAMTRGNLPIPCGKYNRDGAVYAYAASYDWSEGHAKYNPATMKNYVLLHNPQDAEVKTRSKVGGRG